MAKKKALRLPKDASERLKEVMAHYNQWTEDNEQRMTRKNGWNDVTDAYYGKLPADFPYLSKVIDPRIRTSIIEKNARLLNAKLRGRLVPREGGDVLSARLHNALLDFQWDNANYAGTMLEKYSITDQDTRLYASKFALVVWRHEEDEDGCILFDGNEYIPLDIRDCGMDMTAEHIRNAKWFQHSAWTKLEDLDKVSDVSELPLFPGMAELKMKMADGRSDRRDSRYDNRILTNKGLSDRVGDDKAFPVLEVVTEYRRDRFITFSPRYKVILRDIPNPYDHKKIPITQNRYYPIQGDPMGESEVEPVLPIWKAIQATVCGYLDNMNIHMRPPLKIIDGKARIETIVYGAEAQWLMDQADAVQELQTNGEAMRYFQSTYSALVAAFNAAMGDTSQGVSQQDIYNPEKTATEVKQQQKQQNTRDQKNQTSLSETIQDMMSMWMSNNKQFLFADLEKKQYILRIVGTELFNYFQRAGLDELEVSDEAMNMISEIVTAQNGNLSDDDMYSLIDAGKQPRYPVYDNPDEKDPEKLLAKPKMEINETNDGAEITLTPEDLNGTYDYIADVKSMSSGADMELQNSMQKAIDRLTNSPVVLQLLQAEGVQPNIKELLVSELEGTGLRDAERFFTQNQQQPALQQGQTQQVTPGAGGLQPAQQIGGIPPELEATLAAGDPNSMAQPQQIPGQGQIPGGVQPSVQ